MEFEKVEVYLSAKGEISHADVFTKYGKLSITNGKDVEKIIETIPVEKRNEIVNLNICQNQDTVSKSVDESEKSQDDIEITSERVDNESIKEEEVKHTDSSAKEDENNQKYQVFIEKHNKKRRHKKLVKRLIAGIAVFGILGTGFHLVKNHNPYDNQPIKDNSTIYEEDYTETQTDIYANNYGTDDYGSHSDYYQEMENVDSRHEETMDTISSLSEDNNQQISSTDSLQALDDYSMIANANMLEISNYINGSNLEGRPYYYNFENGFGNLNDYLAIKYFSDYRNQVLRDAYNSGNVDLVISTLYSAYASTTEFINLKTPYNFEYNGNQFIVSFDDLSPMGQATVLNIVMGMLNVNLDYSYNNSETGSMQDKLDDISEIQNLYNIALINLENRHFSK